jgi:hypothetical protein
MPPKAETILTCTRCGHQFRTRAKPGTSGLRCPGMLPDGSRCGTSCRVPSHRPAAAPAGNGVDHQADNLDRAWAAEIPFSGQPTRHPRPGGECGTCGEPATQATARGTLLWCGHCGKRQWDAKTLRRIQAARKRMEDAEQRRRELAAAAKAKAEAGQPRPLADQLDVAEQIGKVRGIIDVCTAALERAPTKQLSIQAAGIIARLRGIDAAVKACASQPDPLDALCNLEPVIRAEAARAEALSTQIESTRAAIEGAARMAEHQAAEYDRPEITTPRWRELPPAPAPRAPALTHPIAKYPATALAPSSPILMAGGLWRTVSNRRKQNGECEIPHRGRQPTASKRIIMSHYQYRTGNETIKRVCSAHSAEQVCQAHGYAKGWYWIESLDQAEVG